MSNNTTVKLPGRISFANIWSPKSINGSEAKFSVCCIFPKSDTKTVEAVKAAIEAAKESLKRRRLMERASALSIVFSQLCIFLKTKRGGILNEYKYK